MPAEPHAAPLVPAAAKANAMALRVGAKPVDTDANGYPDLIQAEVYLFSEPHPAPMYDDGAFVFNLYKSGQSTLNNNQPLATWRFGGEELAQARTFSRLFGRAYTFNLSLLESGGDRLPLQGANLTCSFEPAGGSPTVQSTGVYSIQIGSRLASAGLPLH